MSVTIQDYRRTDLRTDSFKGAFWITSRAVDGHEVSGLKDKACVLFSFPEVGQQIIIREIAVNVLTAFTADTVLSLGRCYLASDGLSTNDTVADDTIFNSAYMGSQDINPEIVSWYYPTLGNYVEARSSGLTILGENLIVGAATNVPAVVIFPTTATIIVGKVQVHMLICVVPGS